MAPQQRALGQKDPKTGKVWAGDGWGWQTGSTYTRLAGEGRLNTQRNPMDWLENNLKHLIKTSNQLNQGTKLVGRAGFLPIYENPGGQFASSTPAQRQVAHATTVQPLSNAAMAAVNLGQRLLSGQPLKARKPEGTPAGRAIQHLNDQAAVAMGATPVGQLTQSQRDLLSGLPSSIATNTALGFVPFLHVGAGPFAAVASKAPFLSSGAQQVLGRALQWGANAGINEAASGLLDDSTQGGAGDLLKAMGAPVPDAFLTQPGDDRIQAGLRGVVPGALLGEVPGLAFGALSKTAELAPHALRNLREQRLIGDAARVRQETVNAGLQVPDGAGGYEFQADRAAAVAAPAAAPEATSRPVEGAAPVVERPAGVVDDAAPDHGLTVAPAVPLEVIPDSAAGAIPAQELEPDGLPQYDPNLPELDVPALALDRLDDQGLAAVAQGQGPVLDRIEGVLSQQQLPEPSPTRSTAVAGAPTEALAEPPTPWREQWEGLGNGELLGLAHPDASPDLFERVQGMSGRDWEQFSRQDVLDGLDALQRDGTTVLPQRVGEGQVLADVQGLQVDPARMQFRSGADPANGVVPGQEINDLWDPSREGAIKVWQDPGTGEQVLVDGHRRVEAARRLGVRTLPAEEMVAPTADVARMQGAATNIAEGSASPMDAGRVLRQVGVTDPAGLDSMGIPLQRGAGAMGLSRLPEPVWRAAESGGLPTARAMAIGGSGLDEAGMNAAARFSRTAAGQVLSDSEFAELMSRSASRLQANPLAATEGIRQELEGTGQYISGPVKVEVERYANGNSRSTIEVNTADRLPAEFLAQRGVTDPATLSKVRQATLLRDYTIQQMRQLPPGEYGLDPLTESHRRIYSRWFSDGRVPGISDSPTAGVDAWIYRPQDDPKALINQSASTAPGYRDFAGQVGAAQLSAAVREQLPENLRPVFDQMKSDGPVAQLLDEGGAELSNGALIDVLANRVRLQVERGAEGVAPAAAPVVETPEPSGVMTAADRAALRQQLLTEAVANGEVRPSAQPVLPAPDAPAVDVPRAVADLEEQLRTTGTVAPDTPAARLLEEEARLEAEYAARDAVIQAEVERARREAAGFWHLSFEQRLNAGLIGEGWTREPTSRVGVVNSTDTATAIPSEAVKPYDSLSKDEQAKAIADLKRALGTDEGGLNTAAGYAYATRKLKLNGQVDLDALLGPEKAAKAREQFLAEKLGPEATEARQALRDFYGFNPTIKEKPFYVELGGDDAAVNRVSDELRAIVREVAGSDADVRLADRYKYDATPSEWGGNGQSVGRVHGSYHLMRDIVAINGVLDGTQRQLTSTAYHEAFHRVQYGLLTPKEMRVLDSAYGLERINNYSNLSPAKVATLERMAVAFQNYASARRAGGDVMQEKMLEQLRSGLKDPLAPGVEKIVVAVASAFEKALNVIDRVKNLAKGNGFQTLDDIFERVYRGDIAKERVFDSALELLEPNQVERAKVLQRWRDDNKAPAQDISAALSNLDTQIEALKSTALARGC